jgi:LAGLIDADG DNA endonuclease family
METYFARQARGRPLDRVQHELIVGSLLGDGTLLKTTSGWCFRVHHGLAQRSYVDFKHRIIEQYVQSPPRVSGKGYYFRTVTHSTFSEYREHFYQGARKIIPMELLQERLGGMGLAIWLMDDGNADGGAVRLNTQSFSEKENVALATFLRTKFGLHVRLNRDKSAFRLRIAAASKARLVEVVRPYIHPDMSYKLSL